MKANKYTGEVEVVFGGKKGTLVFDWRAISAIHSKFSEHLEGGFLNVTEKITDMMQLAEILEIGFEKRSPEMTADVILDLSPPLVFARGKVDEALAYAYFGADVFKAIDESQQAEKAEKKKTAKKAAKKKTT